MENRIYEYILKFGSITSIEAFRDLGCTRLSEYIRRLRQKYIIKDKIETGLNRYGEKVHWKRYYFGEKGDR